MTKGVRITIGLAVPFAVGLIFALREHIIGLTKLMHGCTFYKVTGLWCTGCGNTRSVIALLHGQIWRSVRCNPAVLFLVVIAILLYGEAVAGIWGRRVKLIPRKLTIWIVILLLFLAFYIARNFIGVLAPPA